MKFYYTPGACSIAPHIILNETGLDCERVRVDLAKHVTEHGDDYYAITPKGQVPLLEFDDGQRLSEGPVIVQYLCDTAGRTDLMPAAGTLARYRVMEWQNYIAGEIHKGGFSPLFKPQMDANTKAAFVPMLRAKFEWVSSQLKGRDYLVGDTFTGADAYLFIMAQWPKYVGMDVSDLVDLQAYVARIAARPAVVATLRGEGLLK